MQIPLKDTPTLSLLSANSDAFGAVDVRAIETCMDFMRVAKKAMGLFYEHFARFDISPGKYSVLIELAADANGEGLAPSELAARIGVSRPTITGLVDGLVKQGFIEQKRETDDRRRVFVLLTRKGRRFLDQLLPVQFMRMAQLADGMSANDQKKLRTLLGNIESHTDQILVDLLNEKKGRQAR
jgi:DNA-binding MarR family transcriptional regulator